MDKIECLKEAKRMAIAEVLELNKLEKLTQSQEFNRYLAEHTMIYLQEKIKQIEEAGK